MPQTLDPWEQSVLGGPTTEPDPWEQSVLEPPEFEPVSAGPRLAPSEGDYPPLRIDERVPRETPEEQADARRQAAIAKLPPEQQKKLAESATEPYYGASEKPSKLDIYASELVSPWADLLIGVPMRIAGKDVPTISETLPPPEDKGEAVGRGITGLTGTAASFLVPSGPVFAATKAAASAAKVAKALGFGKKMTAVARYAAGVSGFTLPVVASEAVSGRISPSEAAGETVAAPLALPVDVAKSIGVTVENIRDMYRNGATKERIEKTFDDAGPAAALALIHAIARRSLPKKGEILSPEWAKRFLEQNPDAAARLASIENPSRSDLRKAGIKYRGARLTPTEKGLLARNLGGELSAKQAPPEAPPGEGTILPRGDPNLPESGVLPPSMGETGREATALPERNENTIGLNLAEQDAIRKHTGLAELPPADRRKFEAAFVRAKAEKLDESALEIADAAIASPRLITDSEHAGMVLKAAKLANEFDGLLESASDAIQKGRPDAARIQREKAEAVMDQIDRLTRGSRLARREVARSLSIGQMMVNRETFQLADVVRRAQVAKAGRLTPEEMDRFKKLTDQHAELQTKYERAEKEYRDSLAEKERRIAELVAGREVKSRLRRERSELFISRLHQERNDIKRQLVGLGFRMNDITGVSAEASYLLGKLAVNYIREGVHDLGQVARKIIDEFPEVTERDVWRALNTRNHEAQKKIRSETVKMIAELKSQARLLDKIADAESGIFENRPKNVSTASSRVRQLQSRLTALRRQAYRSTVDPARLERAIETINTLQDQIDRGYRKMKKSKMTTSPELEEARGKIAELRKLLATGDQIADLQNQLATGEFKRPASREKPKTPPELEHMQIEVKRLKNQIREEIEAMEPMTGKKIFSEIVNTSRTILATADMSATLRQGLWLSTRRPLLAGKSFVSGFRAFFDTYKAEQIDNAIRNSPEHYAREQSGLFLSPISGGRISAREEHFMARYIEKLPGLGRVVRASARHMVTTLNMIRVGAFDEFVRKNPNATAEELRAWAEYINRASGRGDLGRFTSAAAELGTVFFAPRFAVSRFQTPYEVLKQWKKTRVRNEIAKDMAAFVGLGATALGLAYMAGAEVGTDPRDADFGKIVIGNQHYDLWGGFLQPARLLTRLAVGVTDRIGLTGKLLAKEEKEFSPLEILGRFAAFKLSPGITTPLAIISGESVTGKKVTPSDIAAESLVPIFLQDVRDAYKDGGWKEAIAVSPISFLGGGVSIYEKNLERSRKIALGRAYARFRENSDEQDWFLYPVHQWNAEHPEFPIEKATVIQSFKRRLRSESEQNAESN